MYLTNFNGKSDIGSKVLNHTSATFCTINCNTSMFTYMGPLALYLPLFTLFTR